MNYNFFGAPGRIDLHHRTARWSARQLARLRGCFLQTIMLAARARRAAYLRGSQRSRSYPDIVRARARPSRKDRIVICGMAMGYADTDAHRHTFRPARA